jgi:MerR family transcriptional regulator, light-induced transcriptional regulator
VQPPALGVAAVARRLGVAPDTLRSWHRRYGIGPSLHTGGRHRRYGPEDLARLDLMHRALLSGASSADAARYALNAAADTALKVPLDVPPEVPLGRWAEPAAQSEPAGSEQTHVSEQAQARRSRHGGRGLRMPGASVAARGLGRAVLTMDATAIRQAIRQSVIECGVVQTWDTVLRPVLVAVADRWACTGEGVEVEHLLSECAIRVLDEANVTGPHARNPRPVLLACVPGEWHSLPLSALAAALAEQGVASHLLGAAVPERALHAAVRCCAPAAVVLWALAPLPDLDELVRRLPRTRPSCRWFVAGPGVTGLALPQRVTPLDSLATAVTVVETAVTAEKRPAASMS